MIINRFKFIEETSGQLDDALEVIDSLLAIIKYYVLADQFAGENGDGVFIQPIVEIEKLFKEKQIDKYIEYT